IHRAEWPGAGALREPGAEAKPELLTTAATLIGAVRKAKSDARVSMRTEVAKATIIASADAIGSVQVVLDDVVAAGKLLHAEVVQRDGGSAAEEAELGVELSL
ncbi:MAG: hypothetical protein ACRDQZ_14090, partial [Mycobacteriales bacterium]